MKKLVLAIMLLTATQVFASGKVSFGYSHDIDKKDNEIELGMSVYQKVFGPFYLNSWSGLSAVPMANGFEHDFQNLTLKNGLVFQPVGQLQVETGFEFNKNVDTKFENKELYLKVSTQLW